MKPKCRGLKLGTKEWVYGWYCEVEGKHYIATDKAEFAFECGNNTDDCFGFKEVDPETVGMFTGRKDKDTGEIYEGHILEDDVGKIGIVMFGKLPLDKSGDCVCRYSSFYVKCLGKLGQAPSYECMDIGYWMKIISDIHTTPELIKGIEK